MIANFGQNSISDDSSEKPFSIEDPRQIRIHKRLGDLVSAGAAKFFFDACKLRNEPNDLYTSAHLVAHLLREVESCIRDVITNFEPTNGLLNLINQYHASIKKFIKNIFGKEKSGHKEEIKEIGKILKLEPVILNAWLKLDLERKAHRSGLSEPRTSEDNKDLFERTEIVLDEVLKKFETSYSDVFRNLQNLIDQGPSAKGVKFLKNHIPKNFVAHSYFFSKIVDPNWLDPLRAKGFFEIPPVNEITSEGTRFIPWPEVQYLLKMANQKPSEVKEIILKIKQTDNPSVVSDLLDVCMNLPAEMANELLLKSKEWVKINYKSFALVDDKFGKLIIRWSTIKKDEAAELFKEFVQDYAEKGTKQDSWQFQQFLEKDCPRIIQNCGPVVIYALCDALERTGKIAKNYAGESDFNDSSHVWYPSIAKVKPDIHGDDIEASLIVAIIDGSESIIASKIQILDYLFGKNKAIFHRIAYYLMSKFPEGLKEMMIQKLNNPDRVESMDEFPEFGELLGNNFDNLPIDQQNNIFDQIKNGPASAEDYLNKLNEDFEKIEADKRINAYIKIWQRDRLMWLANSKNTEVQKIYSSIKQEFGAGEKYAEHYKSFSWTGPTSPKPGKEISEMELEELVQYLKTWDPKKEKNEFGFGPSPEGLARELVQAVQNKPNQFADNAMSFVGLHPTYVRGLFWGWQEALKQNQPLNWRPILNLAKWVMEQPREVEPIEKDDSDEHWGHARKTIASVLLYGIERKEGLDISLRSEVWQITKTLMEDPDPEPKDDDRKSDLRLRDYTTAINSVRGESLQVVIIYGLWIKRNLKKEHFGFDDIPEVRDVLDKYLEMKNEPTRAVRSVYGRLFGHICDMDMGWAKTNAPKIFSEGDPSIAAWETYIGTNPAYSKFYPLLKDQYLKAIEDLETNKNVKLSDYERALIDHIAGLYWNSVIELEDPLIQKLFSLQNTEIRAHFIGSFGHSGLYTEKSNGRTVEELIIARLKNLFGKRIEHYEGLSNNNGAQELSDFGWWFASGLLEEDWSMEYLLRTLKLTNGKIEPEHLVFDKLKELVSKYPLKTAQAVDLLVQSENRWLILGNRERIKEILDVLKLDQTTEVKDTLEGIIGRLSARGYLDFLDITKKD